MPNNKSHLHNEIRDKVISLLLDKICFQHQALSLLKAENEALRNNLTVMYKKMILFKSSSLLTMKKADYFSHSKNGSGSSPFLTYNNINRTLTNKLASMKTFSPSRTSYINNSGKNISRNKHSNDTFYSSQDSSIHNTQSFMVSTNDKVSTSKILSNVSSNGYLMTASPRRKGQKILCQKTYRSTKVSFLATEPNVNQRVGNNKNGTKTQEIRNINTNSNNNTNTKKRIRVCVKNTYKWDPLA